MDEEARRLLGDLEADVRSLRIVTRALAARVHTCEEWIDVVSSPLWKRVWFVLSGWRWRHLGRWVGRSEHGRWP